MSESDATSRHGLFNFKHLGESTTVLSFGDLAGISEIVEKIKKEIIFPINNLNLFEKNRVKPVKSLLLKGSMGCGKTALALAIGKEANVPFCNIPSTELVSSIPGASEKNISNLFSEAYRYAPSIIFIDMIDAIGSKVDFQEEELARRMLYRLIKCMDESHKASEYVLLIGATDMPDALDDALRKRFDEEVTLRAPDEKTRLDILSALVSRCKFEGSLDLAKIARSTPGFVGADLRFLVNKAGRIAIGRRLPRPLGDWQMNPLSTQEIKPLSITMSDLEEAAKLTQLYSTRDGFSSIPNVKWEDVGGLPALRKKFDSFIIRPLKYPEDYVDVNLDCGFLLYGPPGCGKTLIAMAVANEAGIQFIHVKGAELLDNYSGDTVSEVKNLFNRAKTCSPCILFFDEVDTMTANEGGVANSCLKQLMLELFESGDRSRVFIIGATNRPEVMDSAFLRYGRFEMTMHVTLPDAEERGSILTALARKKKIDASVNLIQFGRDEACENLSRLDLFYLLNEAGMLAAEETLAREEAGNDLGGSGVDNSELNDDAAAEKRAAILPINKNHLQLALKGIRPSVSKEEKQRCHLFEQKLKAA